jgi:hypothetical protein
MPSTAEANWPARISTCAFSSSLRLFCARIVAAMVISTRA